MYFLTLLCNYATLDIIFQCWCKLMFSYNYALASSIPGSIPPEVEAESDSSCSVLSLPMFTGRGLPVFHEERHHSWQSERPINGMSRAIMCKYGSARDPCIRHTGTCGTSVQYLFTGVVHMRNGTRILRTFLLCDL